MQIKDRQKFLLIVTGAAIALLVLDSLIIEPLIHSWNDRSARIVELRKSIAAGKQTLDRQKTIEDRWSTMRKGTFPAPQSQSEHEIIKSFNRWEQDSQAVVSSIKRQWKQTEDDYTTLVCRADVTGSMEQLSRFIYEVEKDPLALKVEAVEISSHDNDGQQLTLGLQVSGLLLTPKP